MPVFLSGVFYSRFLCRKEPFHVFTNRFYLGQRSPRLIHFALPVMFALFLQAMYGTVDLLIVGQFASSTAFPLWLQDPRLCRL